MYSSKMGPDFVRLAGEAATALSFEGAVLDLLKQAVGFDVAYFSVKGAEVSPTVVGLDTHLVKRAVRGGRRYSEDLLPVKRAALQHRGVAVDTRILGEQGVRRTSYYREVARSVGGRHSLMAYIPLRGNVVGTIMLGRCGSAFSDEHIGSVEALLPALGVARASYGLPGTSEPLHSPAPSGLLGRLGWRSRSVVLATKRIGEITVEVRDRGGFREMVACEKGAELVWTRASLRDPSESGWPYVDLFHVAAIQAKARRRALFVGCGGAVALRQFAKIYPGLAIDLVEREPQVVELARTWYDLDQIAGVSVHIADGATFVKEASPSSWDVAVVDAFDGSDSTAALRHGSFFAALRRALQPGGTLAVNVIGTLDGRGPVREAITELSQAFRRIRVVPVMEAEEDYFPRTLRNVILIASNGDQ